MQGATAIAVPGVVAGMGLAHERFGRLSWRDLLAGAIELAGEGLLVDWYSALVTASSARALALDPDASAMFLEEGRWPIMGTWTQLTERRLDQRAFGATLRQIAERGPREFYAGDVARALDAAFRSRLENMGDNEAPHAPACTTHFGVADRHGNLCAATQTLLSIFGSRVVSPSTGLLMNNGVMWFDPEPGKPNSLAPGKRCLANYCPVVGETADYRRFALGASGGRKILGTVLQISSFMIDHGLSLEEAFHQPRIDMSGGGKVVADRSLPAEVLGALESAFPTITTRRTVFPYAFACPAGVLREGDTNMGCTEIMPPWGDAVAERHRGRQDDSCPADCS